MARETEIERLVVRFVGDVVEFEKAVRKVSEQVNKMANRIGERVTNLGKTFTARLTLPITAFGAASVKAFADFDQAMTQSTSIMDVTAKQTDEMRRLALSLSKEGIQGPAELAKSYFFLASAGLDAEQSMAALPALQKFATAGAFDMALATDLLTDAQSALGLASKDAGENLKNMTRLSDVLVKGNKLANSTVQQFSESLTNTAAASLKNFNKEVEEGVAVLLAYADQGVKGNVAGTNLSRVMLLLSKASRDAADEHERLGFKVFDAAGNMRNFADIIKNIEDITRGMSDEAKAATLEMLGFEARVQQAILPLIGLSEKIRGYEASLRDAAGTTEQVAEKQMKSFTNQMKVLKNEITVLLIEIGEKLIPTFKSMVAGVREAVDFWNRLDISTQENIITIAKWLALIGPGFIVVGTAIKLIGGLAGAYVALGGMISKVIPMLKSMLTLAGALNVAVTGLALGAVAILAGTLFKLADAIKDVNLELNEFARLNSKLVERDVKQQKQIFDKASKLTGVDRDFFLETELEKAERNLQGIRNQVVNAERSLRESERQFGKRGDIFGLGKSSALAPEQANLKDAKKRLESQQALVDSIKEEMARKPVQAVQEAVAETDIASKIRADIEKAIKEAETARREAGFGFGFGENVFDVGKEPERQVNRLVNQRQATTASSAEGRRRIQQTLLAGQLPNAKKKDSDNIQAIRDGIDEIRERGRRNLNFEDDAFQPAELIG